MKNVLIDVISTLKNNRTVFYWAFVIIIIAVYATLFIYSKIGTSDEIEGYADTGEIITLNRDELTYLNSIYYPEQEELEIQFGINNVQSLFGEDNLNAKAITQDNPEQELDVSINKQSPQIITMTISNLPENYLVSRLTMQYKEPGSDAVETRDIYIRHSEERNDYLTETEYNQLAIDFKNQFVITEIESLHEERESLIQQQERLESDINDLQSDTSLLTEEELNSLDNTIQSLQEQVETVQSELTDVEGTIKEREEQRDTIDNLGS